MTNQYYSRGISDLCWRWNQVTRPDILRTSHQHMRCRQIARAIMRRLRPIDYRESNSGAIYPANNPPMLIRE